MNRPALRPVRQRTTACPTCGASRWRPCVAVSADEVTRALSTNRWTVAPHPERLDAEKALAETERETP